MRFLVWDTSTKIGTVGAFEWNPDRTQEGLRLVSEWTLNVEAHHSERLLWSIHQVLEASRWKLEDVDAFGVGIGPGSFTGLRIGISTAKTLSQIQKKPVVGVSSLAIVSRAACIELGNRPCVVISAQSASKGQWFAMWGMSRSVGDCVVTSEGDRPGLWARGVEERLISPEDLVSDVRKRLSRAKEGTSWVVCGDERVIYSDIWKRLPAKSRHFLGTPFLGTPQARYLALLVREAWTAGLKTYSGELNPRYLQVSAAEQKRSEGALPPGPTRWGRGE